MVRGGPWASILAGPPGFLTSPDARRLRVAAQPLPGDPLNTTLAEGADIGLLGMQLETRRRNRMNGRVTTLGNGSFEVTVDQSFGNCPQYIQTRAVAFQPHAPSKPVFAGDRLDDAARAMIGKADTLFIATSTSGEKRSADHGADVSHRGGKPGFVQVEDDRTFVFPDFAGNLHFNTVGNLVVNPRAGFLFVDFASGDLLYLTGRTEIVWQDDEVAAFIGAERLIRFAVEAAIRVEGGLPLRFDFGEYSPMLEHTGSWEQTAETMAAEQERNTYLDYDVIKVEKESETIASFFLKRADGKGLATYEPGQYLPIRLDIPGWAVPAVRTYTLSDAPNQETLPPVDQARARRRPGLELLPRSRRARFPPAGDGAARPLYAVGHGGTAGGVDLGRGRHHADDRDGQAYPEGRAAHPPLSPDLLHPWHGQWRGPGLRIGPAPPVRGTGFPDTARPLQQAGTGGQAGRDP